MTATAHPCTARPGTHQGTGYRHQAVLWRDLDSYLGAAVPFVRDGLAAGSPVMVVVTDDQWVPLRHALGPDAADVEHADMAVLGRNPARIIPAWLDFVARHPGVPLRGISAPVWAGRRPAELVECQIHEAVLNLAVPSETPLRLLCPYDAQSLPAGVLAEARLSHPELLGEDPTRSSATYAGPDRCAALAAQPLTPPTGPVTRLPFAHGRLGGLRRLTAEHAAAAGVGRATADDLALALSELASNSIDHGGGSGVLSTWRDADALYFEVHDAGHIDDPLVGRRNPTPHQARGRGLWMVNRLCDLVQIRSDADGTVVRVVTWL
ncbi:sensor histidine kinase [Actinotalea subterranea]|uniref:sensor histidine kinase n=1 Tax=Actinotalea subterranea TaxID=2607497 RepID=UPI0011ED3070|nr:sensor histidine kinase [Actinotalea subterranea]